MQNLSVKKTQTLRPDDFTKTLILSPAKRKMMMEHYGLSRATLYRLLSAYKYDKPDFQLLIRTAAINVYGAQYKPV